MGGLEGPPKPPKRSGRAGDAVPPLDARRPPRPPLVRSARGEPGRSSTPTIDPAGPVRWYPPDMKSTGFETIVESARSLLEVQTAAAGPSGSLPLTAEML